MAARTDAAVHAGILQTLRRIVGAVASVADRSLPCTAQTFQAIDDMFDGALLAWAILQHPARTAAVIDFHTWVRRYLLFSTCALSADSTQGDGGTRETLLAALSQAPTALSEKVASIRHLLMLYEAETARLVEQPHSNIAVAAEERKDGEED